MTTGSGWVVIKLGGTSVASSLCLENALGRVREHESRGDRALVVLSALAGVTDRLERCLVAEGGERDSILVSLCERHADLAAGWKVAFDADSWLERLRGIAGDADAESGRARLLAQGELMASALVSAWLEARGVSHLLLDAREWLRAREVPAQSRAAHYLSAVCGDGPDAGTAGALGGMDGLLVTQGFIARDESGDTVLLGRGGSDTSAAYFAAILSARELEIWTDVPGLFSANPNEVSGARLLRALDYAEAQEIATSGAKVLHPRCIGPMRRQHIPIRIVHAPDPSLPGTSITDGAPDGGGRVKAVCVRHGVTLVTLETVGMWHQVGFLADAFECFRRRGLSIDMVSTSETSVTVTLDPLVNPGATAALEDLVRDLEPLCRPRVMAGCSAISLVGRHVRANLHRLAPALELFGERRVHLVSQAANDLNFTFVVDEADAAKLVKDLHAHLISVVADDAVFGASWEALREPAASPAPEWWRGKRDALLELGAKRAPVYVYDREAVRAASGELRSLSAVDRVFYAVKANRHPEVLRVLHGEDVGFECVSPGELRHVREVIPELPAGRLLYTPNFAPRGDYREGLDSGAWVTLDNLHPLQAWPELFRDRELFLRVDPGGGSGHHRHVRTAGSYSKFGIPVPELDEARRLAAAAEARIVGLHMHLGSGIVETGVWLEAGLRLASLAAGIPGVRYLDIGGGLGVPERPGDPVLDLEALDRSVAEIREAAPGCVIWLEPGRYFVARAGVLLTRVTQLKGKGEVRYVGADTGMNSLIRPALYGAHHEIVNLTRLEEPAAGSFNVVGPICETGDVLGRERRLPEPSEGDILLVANAGAYGSVMSSRYNLREPAGEEVI